LISGADVLKNLAISADAPPAFLLDANRDSTDEVLITEGWYDNRWCVDFEDFPDASYMKVAGINRLLIWTEGEVRKDLAPMIESYLDMGVEVLTFIDGKLALHGIKRDSAGNVGASVVIPTEKNEAVRKFENARFSLMLITILAFVNLFFMFFVMDAPLLYTAPSLMWMVYLWVSYAAANLLAMVMPIIYLILYLSSQKKRHLMLVASALF